MVNQQRNDEALRELALFAGAGGGILGGHLLGWRTVCAVEYNAYARSVLLARQNDGTLPPFPVWDDVRTFDGKPWRGLIDVVSAGFPCQDISIAGKGAGIEGERSGLWSQAKRIICESQARKVWLENSAMLTFRGLCRILWDLASLGFNAEWGVFSASQVGAPHSRLRIWIMAVRQIKLYPSGYPSGAIASDAMRWEQEVEGELARMGRELELDEKLSRNSSDSPDSGMGGMDDGMARRMERLKSLGNGQVPRMAAAAWTILNN